MAANEPKIVEQDTFEDLEAMVKAGRLSRAAADAIRDAVTNGNSPITPKARRERLKLWIGSIDSDATDASTTIRETLKRVYGNEE